MLTSATINSNPLGEDISTGILSPMNESKVEFFNRIDNINQPTGNALYIIEGEGYKEIPLSYLILIQALGNPLNLSVYVTKKRYTDIEDFEQDYKTSADGVQFIINHAQGRIVPIKGKMKYYEVTTDFPWYHSNSFVRHTHLQMIEELDIKPLFAEVPQIYLDSVSDAVNKITNSETSSYLVLGAKDEKRYLSDILYINRYDLVNNLKLLFDEQYHIVLTEPFTQICNRIEPFSEVFKNNTNGNFAITYVHIHDREKNNYTEKGSTAGTYDDLKKLIETEYPICDVDVTKALRMEGNVIDVKTVESAVDLMLRDIISIKDIIFETFFDLK